MERELRVAKVSNRRASNPSETLTAHYHISISSKLPRVRISERHYLKHMRIPTTEAKAFSYLESKRDIVVLLKVSYFPTQARQNQGILNISKRSAIRNSLLGATQAIAGS